jgi:hypothetical protein
VSVEVSLKTKSFAKPCFTALFRNKQLPLSPPVEVSKETLNIKTL